MFREMADYRPNKQYFEGNKLPQISSIMQDYPHDTPANQNRLQLYSEVIETPDLIKHGYQILNQQATPKLPSLRESLGASQMYPQTDQSGLLLHTDPNLFNGYQLTQPMMVPCMLTQFPGMPHDDKAYDRQQVYDGMYTRLPPVSSFAPNLLPSDTPIIFPNTALYGQQD